MFQKTVNLVVFNRKFQDILYEKDQIKKKLFTMEKFQFL